MSIEESKNSFGGAYRVHKSMSGDESVECRPIF